LPPCSLMSFQDRRTNTASKAPDSSRYALRKVSASAGVRLPSSARVSSPKECAVPPIGRAESPTVANAGVQFPPWASCQNPSFIGHSLSIVLLSPLSCLRADHTCTTTECIRGVAMTNRARSWRRCSGRVYSRSLYAMAVSKFSMTA
jgi:hypothetical protein